jgi:methylase of polypeptide subunit release factors
VGHDARDAATPGAARGRAELVDVAPQRILDIGTGTGGAARALAKAPKPA